MTVHTYPIVGAYYHPPAKLLLDSIPIGAEMFLHADPGGTYCNADHNDPTAVSVWLLTAAIPENADLELKLSGYGCTIEELKAHDSIHVGYIPKEIAAQLAPFGSEEVPGEFTLSARGAPRVRFEL